MANACRVERRSCFDFTPAFPENRRPFAAGIAPPLSGLRCCGVLPAPPSRVPTPRCLHEFPRIPSQGIVRPSTASRCRPAKSPRRRKMPWRLPSRSAASSGWSRRRFTPAAAARPAASSSASRSTTSGAAAAGMHGKKMETYQSGGPRTAGQRGAGHRRQRHRQGAVPVDPGRSRQQGGVVHRVGARRRRYRTGRARDAGRHSHDRSQLRRRPAAVRMPSPRVRHGPECEAGEPADQDHAGPVQAVQRAGSRAGRTQSRSRSSLRAT